MSGLKNTEERLFSFGTTGKYSTREERRQERLDKEQSRKDKMFHGAALPDEEEIKRIARKKAARRRGSRANTVLTDLTDQLG
jgi:hypothetical protein